MAQQIGSHEAVAHPVRLGLLRHLTERGPASLRELAGAVRVHLNTVRPHARALEHAGLIARVTEPPRGRGRPAVRYRLADDVAAPARDFRGLAEALSAALARQGQPVAALRSFGREWGRWLLGRPGDRVPERDLGEALERLGFHARLGDKVVELTGCPCPLVAPDDPEQICVLATGVVDGVLDATGSGLCVARATHRPQRRRCTLALEPVGLGASR
jgi:predicted ArsR family transcriptional regulator